MPAWMQVIRTMQKQLSRIAMLYSCASSKIYLIQTKIKHERATRPNLN